LLASSSLFLLLLPILDFLNHPESILYGPDYEPLVLRFSRFYAQSGLFAISVVCAPVILTVYIVMMQKQGMSFVRSLLRLLCPFLLALTVDYFVSAQLDKYLQYQRYGLGIPWESVFQLSSILDYARSLLGYVIICGVLYFGVELFRRITPTKRRIRSA
jgi:hypothetical protein